MTSQTLQPGPAPGAGLIPEQPCAACRQVITEDPSGRCEDCQQGVPSQRPGSITDDQRWALIGPLMDQGLVGEGKWRARAALFTAVTGTEMSSDLGTLSQQQAEDLLGHLRVQGTAAAEGELTMPPRMPGYDPYAFARCPCKHLQYADDQSGGPCRFCDCRDHRPAASAATDLPGPSDDPALTERSTTRRAGEPQAPASNGQDEGRALGGLNNAHLPGPSEPFSGGSGRAGEPTRQAGAS